MPGRLKLLWPIVFFFQAEDGIRDLTVTGVQTCALPILSRAGHAVFAAEHAGCAESGVYGEGRGRDRELARDEPGAGVLFVYKLLADERALQPGPHAGAISVALAGDFAALRFTREV